MDSSELKEAADSLDVAVVGMAGRFPGARDLDAFWQNLRDGVESISFFTEEEVEGTGVEPAVARGPNYVKAGGVLEGAELFDASLFSFYPREAALMDPQHRVFLECAWEALEHAGYNPDSYKALIGVYAGTSINTYLLFNLFSNPDLTGVTEIYQLAIGNDKDFLPTRVSYKLNLRGPSINIQTACSTSLVATHLACQDLLGYQCDLALAGGVSIRLPQKRGYLYQEGSIASPDGHCRAFDARARGTIGGNGVGIVVLKRLEDALADGDTIHTIIRGSAINNDGALKVGYTAPSVDGQADVIATAQMIAGVDPETISYIETHGTGTSLGDPIEIAALTQVFRASTQAKQFCAIGSVKPNIGHLDAGAGVASLIKTVLALKHKQIPPSINFERPNPQIDFENSPFYVNAALSDWETDNLPRRAGVSSFGIGGTNAHVVVEEAPPREPSGPSRPWQLLTLSARTPSALDAATANLAAHLRQYPDLNLADVAYTCHVGRKVFEHRRTVLCRDMEEAMDALESLDPERVLTGPGESEESSVVFMFTGQGAQYANMALGLYRHEPVFREEVDRCAELLEPLLDLDLRTMIYPAEGEEEAADEQLRQTAITQPALFVIEYALAKVWMSWGIEPQAMIGHSSGEYVAACLAGVFALEDALALMVARGRMMQGMPGGAMVSVSLTEQDIEPYLDEDLSVGALNAPGISTVSGTYEAVDALEARLEEDGVAYRRLRTSHAFHSPMMEPILEPFAERVAQCSRRKPRIPFISNVTGTWITPEQATDPRYWARHLRQTVRFADGVSELLKEPSWVLLEVGPGRTLSSLARRNSEYTPDRVALSSLRHPKTQEPDEAFILNALGALWLAGVWVDWHGFYAQERRHRLPLPTYPFERQRYWVEPGDQGARLDTRPKDLHKNPEVAEWFYMPSWKRADLTATPGLKGLLDSPKRWLIFTDGGLGARLARRLRETGQKVVIVEMGDQFGRTDERTLMLDPGEPADYDMLFRELSEQQMIPDEIVHLWSVTEGDGPPLRIEDLEELQSRGTYSLLFLAQALQRHDRVSSPSISVVSTNVQEVTGAETLHPVKATLLGPAKVIAQECPGLVCRVLDVEAPEPGIGQAECLVDNLIAELVMAPCDAVVAYRGRHRWVQTFEPVRWDGVDTAELPLRQGGVYLITGGLGRIGLLLADYLARTVQAQLVLTGRSPFPAKDEWEQWLKAHDGGDGIGEKIRELQAIEAHGGDVMVASADVADLEQMRVVIDRTREQLGPLNGVIHAAGLVGEAAVTALQETDSGVFRRQFQAKVHGLRVLEEVLQGESLDFCVLQSSLSSVLGGLGFAAYAAANAFMDAFAHKHNQIDAVPWTSVNWDGWRFGDEPGRSAGLEVAELTITPEEGVEAFQRVLRLNGAPQIVVSTGDLQARIERWIPSEVEEETTQPEEKPIAGPRFPRPQLRTAYVAPRSDLEEAITELWQEVLGLEQVGVHDDFFELGGHSLLATQIISRLRDTYQVELPLRRIFENPKVSGLAEIIDEGREEARPEAAAPSIQPVPREGGLPLSFGQQRLWFLDQLEPGSPLYNNFAAVRLRGALDIVAMGRSLNEIAQRHETLRTIFDEREGQPTQIIAPDPAFSLPVIDLTHLTAAEQELRIQELAVEEARTPFDLTEGPLMRITLLRLDDTEHVAFMTMHHIVSDGWSLVVFIRELATLYEAFSEGRTSPLPDLPIQYVDYVYWQRDWLRGEVLENQLDYWEAQLAHPPVLDLPTDRPRPAIQTSQGANQWFELTPSLREGLDELSRAEHATLFMTLMAALQALLHRYSGQEDITVGTPIANRNRSETEGLIGFLLNTLVVRTDLSGDPAFRELLAQVREAALEAYAHQDLPFEMLVEKLQPERDMSRSPLFQVMFDLQDEPLSTQELAGLTLEPLQVDNGTAKFDLALSMEQGEDCLGGYLNYNTGLFQHDTIARMLGHFQMLLEGIVENPDRHISELTLLTESEREQLLVDWSCTAMRPKPYRSISQLFEVQAAIVPNRTAVILDEERLTYEALNRRANRLANHLRSLGVGPEDIIGLYLERSVEAIIAMLGVLKAGGAYLPLDPANPQERLSFILDDAGISVLLTQERLLERVADSSLRTSLSTLLLDANWGTIAQASPENPPDDAPSESLAYVIYTSGSTGRPKGVLISNEALSHHCRDIRERFRLTPDDRVLQFAAYSFDQSVEQILATLITGATLVLRGPEVWPPADFSKVVADFGLTVVNLPPAYWHQWVQDWDAAYGSIPDDQLKLVISGGDVMRADALRHWWKTPMGSARLLNAYGPTETTVTAMTYEIQPGFDDSRIPIGRPPANRSIHILDRHGKPVPIGVPGELYLGGAGLARGYLDRPEITAAQFVPDPFSDEVGARLYRTGDLVRYRSDGNVEFLGRVDQQVKVRGFRIELGEIETALVRHVAVQEVAVVAHGAGVGKSLVAYLVSDHELQPTTGELQSFLKESLPDYMVPSLFMWLDALPLTSSGKVNRRALPAPDGVRPAMETDYVAPRTPVEEDLVAMWTEVLEVDRVGVHDNFFDLGGHSLMATQLVSRVRAAYQVDLPLRRLFEAPTVAGLATLIEEGLVEQVDEEEMAALLDELEGLSDQEVEALLADEV
jgi:amino acid adenylation domain-containing protein